MIRAFIVGLRTQLQNQEQFNKSFDELLQLARTAGVKVMGKYHQFLKQPVSATFIGSGKVKELARLAREKQVKTLIFNQELTPSQARNIANLTRCNVVDRTELILDIFASHARSRQAKLQVELAQLEYSYSRLKNRWKHLSRIQGGIGFRGPGEKQIETDRREIKTRINILQKRLKDIRSTTETKRKNRENALNVSLVGYTNAGKSSIFNLLTNEGVYTANKLFATLDSKSSRAVLKNGLEFIISDTIGFINDLPHHLIESFNSTLLDVQKANLLLHIVDISEPRIFETIKSVEKVLLDLGANEKNILLVFNKTDLLSTTPFAFLKKQLREKYTDCVFVSARKGDGMPELIQKITFFISAIKPSRKLVVPAKLNSLVDFIRNKATINQELFDESSQQHHLDVKISDELYEDIVSQIKKHELMEYINS